MIPLGALSLAIVCSLGWAGLDVFRKQLSAAVEPVPLLVLLNLGLLPVFAVWWGIVGGGIADLGAYALPGGLDLILQVVANVLFLAAVRASPLSLSVPFLALTPVFATLAGAVALDERPSPVQLVGVGLVVLGALALSTSRGPSGGGGEDGGGDGGEDGGEREGASGSRRVRLLHAFMREPGARMMTGVALCWGVSTSLDKQALLYAALPIHALIQLGGVILVALAYLLVHRRLASLTLARGQWWTLALATLTGAIAFGVQLLAIQYILVSVLETIKRALGLVSAVVLGRLVFGEAISALKLVAVVLMTVGVVLVML